VDLDQSSLAAKLQSANALGPNPANNLQSEAWISQQSEPKSYLDKAVGVVFSNEKIERNIVEAAKTGSVFLNGKFGLASSLTLYALDQIKVGDSLPQVAIDAGLGIAKGLAMRSLNQTVGSADLGIAGQAFTLGTGSRLVSIDAPGLTGAAVHLICRVVRADFIVRSRISRLWRSTLVLL